MSAKYEQFVATHGKLFGTKNDHIYVLKLGHPSKKVQTFCKKLGYWWDHDLYLVATDRSCYMSLPRSDQCSLALADRAHFQFQTDVKYRTKPLTFDPSLPLHLCQCSHAIPSRGDARIISELACACGI